jgi:CDGSH-type Zn-finger protein
MKNVIAPGVNTDGKVPSVTRSRHVRCVICRCVLGEPTTGAAESGRQGPGKSCERPVGKCGERAAVVCGSVDSAVPTRPSMGKSTSANKALSFSVISSTERFWIIRLQRIWKLRRHSRVHRPRWICVCGSSQTRPASQFPQMPLRDH